LFADISNLGCIELEPLPSPFQAIFDGYTSPLTRPKLNELVQLLFQPAEYIVARSRDFLQLLGSTQLVIVFRIDGCVYGVAKDFHSACLSDQTVLYYSPKGWITNSSAIPWYSFGALPAFFRTRWTISRTARKSPTPKPKLMLRASK